MKNWRFIGVLTVLIIGIVLMSGCISPGSKNAEPIATPTPQIVYVTVLVTPTPTVARAQDPIIGVWRYSNSGYDYRYRFNADGTYAYSNYYTDGKGTFVFYGTWNVQGGNSYTLKRENGNLETIIYDPVRNTFYNTKYTPLLYTPYQGDVAAAS